MVVTERSLAVAERGLDAGDSDRGCVEHEAGFEAQDSVAKSGEHAVATSVGPGATEMGGAIDFDNEASRGSQEVGDIATGEGNLATERDPELATREQPPERGFRGGWRVTHGVRTLGEECLAFLVELGLAHEDLRLGSRPDAFHRRKMRDGPRG